jgi:hypothetical protein
MNSIFEQKDNHQLIERVKQLRPETQALWGKMNVSQMLAHVNEPLLVMKGEKTIKYTLIGRLFGNYLKNKFIKDRGFGKNLLTHEKFKVVDQKQFQQEQEKLIATLQLLQQKGTAIITKNKHPFFGNMTHQEWGDMMYIHTDHHLKQFGV